MAFDFDLFVIGGGSGGVRAARLAAQSGARVGLAEEFRYGGTCVIRGCVPKKLLVYASAFSAAFEDAPGYGWSVGDRSFDWSRLVAAKDREVARLEAAYRRNLEAAGVTLFDTRAWLADPHTVRTGGGGRFSTSHILVATGGTPFVPDIPGAHHAITSNEIFDLAELPDRMAVVGGGYIACEFAGIMNGLGAQVVQLYRGDRILRGFDDDIRDVVASGMSGRGVDIRVGTDVLSIEGNGDGLAVHDSRGGRHVVDQVLYATGRRPNSDGLGLAEAGVAVGARGEVSVDGYSQTSVPSVFAVGDVTDRVNLTPVAIREGAAFVESVFRGNPTKPDHLAVPTAVFTQPEVGTVGMSEAEARASEGPRGGVDIYRSRFRPMYNSLSGRNEDMLVKLVVARRNGRVLGLSRRRAGGGGDDPARRRCREDGRHEGRLRQDGCRASHGSGGTRDAARARGRLRMTPGSVGTGVALAEIWCGTGLGPQPARLPRDRGGGTASTLARARFRTHSRAGTGLPTGRTGIPESAAGIGGLRVCDGQG